MLRKGERSQVDVFVQVLQSDGGLLAVGELFYVLLLFVIVLSLLPDY